MPATAQATATQVRRATRSRRTTQLITATAAGMAAMVTPADKALVRLTPYTMHRVNRKLPRKASRNSSHRTCAVSGGSAAGFFQPVQHGQTADSKTHPGQQKHRKRRCQGLGQRHIAAHQHHAQGQTQVGDGAAGGIHWMQGLARGSGPAIMPHGSSPAARAGQVAGGGRMDLCGWSVVLQMLAKAAAIAAMCCPAACSSCPVRAGASQCSGVSRMKSIPPTLPRHGAHVRGGMAVFQNAGSIYHDAKTIFHYLKLGLWCDAANFLDMRK